MATSPTTTDWHPADIVAALRKTRHKWSLRGLSVARGYSSNAASVALHKPWTEVEWIIADALREFGIRHPNEIWPSRYNADGSPKRRREGVALHQRRRQGVA